MQTRPRIMIVDDEPDFLFIVRQWLEPRFEVVPLPDGQGLLELLDGLRPDLLLLDVNLPGENGFRLCRKVLAEPRFQKLPVVFLTASCGEKSMRENVSAGGSAYLTKPLDRETLLFKLDELLPVGGRR
jgi:CheY-like chemotaxis protein